MAVAKVARAAKDAAEDAAVAEAEKENTTKANGATLKTGVTVRRPLLMAKATGAEKATGVEKAIGDIGARCSLLSILRQCRMGKAKAGLRLQVHGSRGRPRSAAKLAVSFPLAGRQKFRLTGSARRRRTLPDVTMMRLAVWLHAQMRMEQRIIKPERASQRRLKERSTIQASQTGLQRTLTSSKCEQQVTATQHNEIVLCRQLRLENVLQHIDYPRR